MLILILVLIAVSAVAGVILLVEMVPGRQGAMSRRLDELQQARGGVPDVLRRRGRRVQAERLAGVIEMLGQRRVDAGYKDVSGLRLRLVQAGYASASAVPIYLGARVFLPAALIVASLMVLPVIG